RKNPPQAKACGYQKNQNRGADTPPLACWSAFKVPDGGRLTIGEANLFSMVPQTVLEQPTPPAQSLRPQVVVAVGALRLRQFGPRGSRVGLGPFDAVVVQSFLRGREGGLALSRTRLAGLFTVALKPVLRKIRDERRVV